MEHLIEVTVGGRSSYFVWASGDKAAVEEAYRKGSEIVGWSLAATVAVEYEDNRIPVEKLRRLRELGYEGDVFDERYHTEKGEGADDEGWWFEPDEYVEAWAFVVGLGGVEVVFIGAETVHAGGYGCFY